MKKKKVMERLGEVSLSVNEFILANARILRGVLWAIAVVALVLSIINLKKSWIPTKVYARETENEEVVKTEDESLSREDIENIIFETLSETLINYSEELKNSDSEKVIEKSDIDIEKLQQEILTKIEEKTKAGLTPDEEERIREIIESTVQEVDYNKIQELIDASKGEVNTTIETVREEITNEITESRTEIINSTTEADEYLKRQIEDNKNHLTDKNGSSREFQYGYDEKSGAYGYFVDGVFNPF